MRLRMKRGPFFNRILRGPSPRDSITAGAGCPRATQPDGSTMQNHEPQTITLTLEPDGGERTIERPKTAAQLLNRLKVRQGTALVIRDGELLTPDRRIEPGDAVTVREVVSRG